MVCGSDNLRWVAYAFVDAVPGDDEVLEEMSCSYEGVQDDPIASDYELDANSPIWDPREYFLMIVAARMIRVLGEWEDLVRTVERSIKEYVYELSPLTMY